MIILTETWTNQDIQDEYLVIKGFEMTAREDRKDTKGGRGGGILVYARKEIDVWRDSGCKDFNQMVTVKIGGSGQDVTVHVIYRSPNSSSTNDEELNKWVKSLSGKFIIIGDLNYPGIQWENG